MVARRRKGKRKRGRMERERRNKRREKKNTKEGGKSKLEEIEKKGQRGKTGMQYMYNYAS